MAAHFPFRPTTSKSINAMRAFVRISLMSVAVALVVSGCKPVAEPSATAPPAPDPTPVATVAPDTVAKAGDGDGQGDAKVAGTNYNATAQIRCAGYQGVPAGMCDAGVVRGTETGTYIEVALPDGVQRTIFFNADGSFLSFSTAQADGTAAMETTSRREGDTTIATLGSESYEIPDVFVLGD
jgi:hypothetical protein